MKIKISAFENGAPIPGENSFCIPADPVTLGANRNPAVGWTDAPAGTKSFALIVVDPDVPSKGDDVNQAGKTVPADLPRVDFYHWVLVDIPAGISEIPAGADSDGVTAKGKALGATRYGVRGINDYTGWFAGDPDMAGNYGGYDGPCPPWNDEIIHHYHFTVYSLDVETLGLTGAFGGAEAIKAMEGHILAKDSHVGTYTLNKALF